RGEITCKSCLGAPSRLRAASDRSQYLFGLAFLSLIVEGLRQIGAGGLVVVQTLRASQRRLGFDELAVEQSGRAERPKRFNPADRIVLQAQTDLFTRAVEQSEMVKRRRTIKVRLLQARIERKG